MQTEGEFWRNKLKTNVIGRWVRIESNTIDGIPDCIALVNGVTSWVELKSKPQLEEGLGTTPLQRHFLKRWCADGGRAFLLAKVGESVFFIWGEDVEKKLTLEQWRSRALVFGGRTLDYDAIAWYMSEWTPAPYARRGDR